ncbi:MraY family glycosyltransferase [Cereibacter azotoformans]|uniref:MraY family glycosyltransferase n=1 Tax=Cereibacter azotoformans TaxID=43057 RepID=UPI000C6C993B|nr:glycosyltransferase [Cereibacter azotoformans]
MTSGQLIPIITAFSASVLTAALVAWTRDHHIALVLRRNDLRAVQASHCTPTPRLGGLAVLAGLAAGALLASHDDAHLWSLILASAAPVALAGLAEDLGLRIPPAGRLAAAALSSLVAVITLQLWLARLDIPGLDLLMAWSAFAIPFSIFSVMGVCNAFNLIDGMNGLSGFTGVATALGLAAVALQAEDPGLVWMALLLVSALVGFLIFNYPQARIFLGDAGAYALGHLLAWVGILSISRIDELTPWAVLLIFFWPVADTLLAIWRRRTAGRPSDEPDRLHFHQLVMRALEILILGRQARRVANPLTTLILLPMIAAPIAAGVLLWDHPLAAFAALAAFGALFIATYMTGMTLAARRGRYLPSLRARIRAANAPWTTARTQEARGELDLEEAGERA